MNANLYNPGQERFRSFAPPVLDAIPLDDAPLGPRINSRPATGPKPGRKALEPQPAEPGETARPKIRQPKALKPLGRAEAAPERPSAHAHNSRRRRPLSRFVDPEENPNFYLSLSDLMCLLVVFFVLIFSLSGKGASATLAQDAQEAQATQAAAAPKPRQVVKAAIPLPPLRAEVDPFPNPEPLPAGVRMGMVSVAAAGQSDPGLVSESRRAPGDRPVESAPAFDSALFTLVASGEAAPAAALPAGEPTLDDMLNQVQSEARAGAGGLEVEKADGRVILRLPEAITFDLAKAEIKPGMKDTLARLANMLVRHQEVPVIVTGHTDDLPINTPAFASNWELSSARASAVGRALVVQGLDQSRLTIRGLADRQPRVPNDSETHRGQNRRVEIELRLNG